MKSRKSIFLGISIVLLLTTCFTNLTFAANEMTFMGWGQPSEQAIFTKMIAKFEAQNPGIKVKYINVDPGQFPAKITTMIAARNVPDVFYVPQVLFGKFVKAKVLLNLSPILNKSHVFKKSDIWPQALTRWSYNGHVIGKGNVYALPKDLGPYPMVYNKTLMAACGITPPDPKIPWTWDQFMDAAKKMTKDTNGDGKNETFGVAFIPTEAAVWSHGGDWVSKDRKKITINSPGWVAGAQFSIDLTNKYHYAPNAQESATSSWWNRWLAGEIGIAGMGPWDQPTFWNQINFDWDIAPWPMDAKLKISRSWCGSMGIGVAAASAHKKEALDLAAYLTLDPDGQRELYQLGQSVPNIMSIAKGEFLKMDKAPKSRFVFNDYIEKYSAPDVAWGSIDTKWLDTLNQDWAEVANGKISVADWVVKEQPKLQKLYEEGGNIPQ